MSSADKGILFSFKHMYLQLIKYLYNIPEQSYSKNIEYLFFTRNFIAHQGLRASWLDVRPPRAGICCCRCWYLARPSRPLTPGNIQVNVHLLLISTLFKYDIKRINSKKKSGNICTKNINKYFYKMYNLLIYWSFFL